MNQLHRPRFHFLPERNWMNDPNGLIQWQGQTHLFYQYNPNGPFDGTKHWGHAVSDDLVHWTHWPLALAPGPDGPDAGGCWSGCAVDHDGVPALVYTGVDPQVVCLATSMDGLLTWAKHPANPVIAGPPRELAAQARGQFRDPYVWREDGAWHMVIGCMQAGQGGLVLRYRSTNLVHWDYAGEVLRGDMHQTEPLPTGTMWECPNYIELDGRRVLIYSAYSEIEHVQYPVYYAASASDQPFTPSAQGIVVHGPSFYAPHGRRLDDGRTLMWGWLKEASSTATQLQQGWSGVLSLPLVLTWRPGTAPGAQGAGTPPNTPGAGGGLGLAPAEELKALRGEHWHFENLDLEPGASGLPGDIRGDCLEIDAIIVPTPGAEFGLRLRCSPGGEEHTDIVYQGAEQAVAVDTRASGQSIEGERGRYAAPAIPDANGQVRLRIFLDRSVLEVFAGDSTCLASRIYPTRADSLGLELFSKRGSARLVTMDVWKLDSIW
jgi:beta-fructofuranosidase